MDSISNANIYTLAIVVILALSGGLGGWAVQRRRNNGRNGRYVTPDELRAALAEHYASCPRLSEVRAELNARLDRIETRLDSIDTAIREVWRAGAERGH